MSDAALARCHRAIRALAYGCGSWSLVVAIALPWVFYDWAHHRHSGFMMSMLSQMGMMVILALSYNMLLGQAGLFSLCHATFFGIGGYSHDAFPQCRRRW